jgi:hypothetical protein
MMMDKRENSGDTTTEVMTNEGNEEEQEQEQE